MSSSLHQYVAQICGFLLDIVHSTPWSAEQFSCLKVVTPRFVSIVETEQ